VVSSLSVAELLAPLRADPPTAGVFSDFDGTLAPIVDDPAAAAPLPGVVDVLGALAARYGVVGVVSGRPAAFLRSHLGGHSLFLSGLYGLERVTGDGGIEVVPDAAPWVAVVEEAATAADADLGLGPAVERNGLSVVLHVRTAPARADEVDAWVTARAEATGLVLHRGRMSYELRPPLEFDKGTAMAGAAAGGNLRSLCFLGDDRGDLSAFAALDRLDRDGATTVKVAVRSAEVPEELLDRADVVVDGPEGALDVLRALLD
jgi:trehalose 6-phosphate phosphatase